jgi:carbohydrate diacid regulator
MINCKDNYDKRGRRFLLTDVLAQKIIAEASQLIKEDLIIVNRDGYIIASTDPNRVGTFHEGACLCMAERRKRLITAKDATHLKGVKPGLNLPIVVFQQVAGVIGITGEPEQMEPYGELLRRMTELLIQEAHMMEQMQWQTRALQGFVQEWLEAGALTEPLKRQAAAHSLDVQTEKQIVLIETGLNESIHWRGLAQWREQRKGMIAIPWERNKVLLVCSPQTETALKATVHTLAETLDIGGSWWGGAGRALPPDEIMKSYAEAQAALAAARKTNRFVFEHELKLELCVEAIPADTKARFVERVLKKVGDEQELLGTLATFLENDQSLKRTAEALHVHINTLHYRFHKLKQHTGLDVRKSEDFVLFYLAHLFLEDSTKKADSNGDNFA